jgi:hypothetical protein
MRYLLISAIILCSGCPNKSLQVGLASLNAARDGFVAYDAKHQSDIVDAAKSLEEGKASLAEYRTKREPLIQAFAVAYSALAAAALDDTEARLAEAGKTAIEVYRLVKELMGGSK